MMSQVKHALCVYVARERPGAALETSLHVHVVVFLRDSGGFGGGPPATGPSGCRLARRFLSYEVPT